MGTCNYLPITGSSTVLGFKATARDNENLHLHTSVLRAATGMYGTSA